MRQLPNETRKFKYVDKIYGELALSLKSTPQLVKICANDSLLPKIKDANIKLASVKNDLTLYLNVKR